MGSCGAGCEAKSGCSSRKGAQGELLRSEIARIYPGRAWGRPDDDQAALAAPTLADRRSLGRAIARELRAPVYARAGGDADLCDYLYVLCVGRHPGLVDVRDGRASFPADTVDEVYLRVNVSALSRSACVQEVRMSVSLEGDVFALEERPRDGVVDGILLNRFQRLIVTIEEAGFRHLDMGMLEKRPEGVDGAGYAETWGGPPTYLSFLFYPQPPTTSTTTFHPAV